MNSPFELLGASVRGDSTSTGGIVGWGCGFGSGGSDIAISGEAAGGVGSVGGATGAVSTATGAASATMGAASAATGGASAATGACKVSGVSVNGSPHVGQFTVCPVPSEGYSMDWPQCGHSPFKKSSMLNVGSSLKIYSYYAIRKRGK
ncbi:MAG TPA: hypothetical protein VF988_14560 [Verrucomicrobiae bacterium]